MAGWTIDVSAPDYPKCIICVAPHTSNWDFVFCKLAYNALNRTACFLMKSSWFFFPLGAMFRAMGGIPVYRKNKRGSLVEQLVERFDSADRLTLAITPEGTRSRNPQWHTGFLQIAYKANVPVLIGVLDYGKKQIRVNDVFIPTGDFAADLAEIQKAYHASQAKYPAKFSKDGDR